MSHSPNTHTCSSSIFHNEICNCPWFWDSSWFLFGALFFWDSSCFLFGALFFWDSSCFLFGALFFWDSSCFFFGAQLSQNCQMKSCLKPLQRWYGRSWNPLILKGGGSPFSFGWSPCMIPPIHVGASSKSILAVGHGVKFLREFKSQNLKTRFAISFVFKNCIAAATTTTTSTTYLQVLKVQLVLKTTLVWKESVAKTKHYIGPHDDLVESLVIESHWARARCGEDGAKLYHHHDSVIAITPWKLCKGLDCLLEFFSQEMSLKEHDKKKEVIEFGMIVWSI